MDVDPQLPIASQNQVQGLMWMKLAVAVAVIRTKPAHLTVRQHAEKICSQFLQLQAHVDRNTNKQVKLTTLVHVPDNGAESQLTPPASSERASSQEAYRETVQQVEQSCIGHSSLVEIHRENDKFCQSLRALQNISKGSFIDSHQAVLAVTHLQSLRSVLVRDLTPLSQTAQCQAAYTIVHVLELCPWLEDHPSFMQELCSLLDQLVQSLITKPTDYSQFPPHRQKRSLVMMLLVFTQRGPLSLALSVLDLLVESVEALCRELWNSLIPGGKLVCPDLFENSFFTLQCIEMTLVHWCQGHCPVHPSQIEQLQHRLEACLTAGVTDRYPLIAQVVVRLASLAEALLQNRGLPGCVD